MRNWLKERKHYNTLIFTCLLFPFIIVIHILGVISFTMEKTDSVRENITKIFISSLVLSFTFILFVSFAYILLNENESKKSCYAIKISLLIIATLCPFSMINNYIRAVVSFFICDSVISYILAELLTGKYAKRIIKNADWIALIGTIVTAMIGILFSK